MKKIMNRKFGLIVLITSVFVSVFWVAYVFVSDFSVGTISQSKEVNIVTSESGLTFDFMAEENNLGIVEITFCDYCVLPKEKIRLFVHRAASRDTELISTNEYDVAQFTEIRSYPFGFPIQDNSTDKKYVITLVGNQNQNVFTGNEISSRVIVKYHYSIQDLISTPRLLVKKIIYGATLPEAQKVGIILFLLQGIVLGSYLAWRGKGRFSEYAIIDASAYIALMFVVLFDILIVPRAYNFLTLIIAGIWFVHSLRYSFYSIKNYLPIVVLCVFLPVLLIFELYDTADKVALWLFYLLLFSVISYALRQYSFYEKIKSILRYQ